MPSSSPTNRPHQAPPAAPTAIARPIVNRPVTVSIIRRSEPMIVTFSTGNFSSERKSTAACACG
jgi:hypothetical protein